jgi:hypothetical protein
MKVRVPELFLGVFLAVAVFAMGMLFQASYNPGPASSSQTQHSKTATKPPATDRVDAGQPDEQREGKSEFWFAKLSDWMLTAFTGLLVLFTYRLWKSTDRLWEAGEKQFRQASAASIRQDLRTQDQLKLARDEFIATHRPKIKIHAVEVKRTEAGDNVFLGASILAFNVGESVAKNVEVRGQIFMGPNFALDVARPIVKTIPEVSSGQKLRAEINSDCQVSYAAAARRTGVIFYCIGWIAYWDESDQRRETGFCFQPEFSNEGDRWVSQ